ncbi:3'(2'),5'-bisphosphate nucleotidase CysQ [Salinarimonas sp.]|uniref:3'(2'),5'-bisphosphate nucleotidase CysQ n=1 Tax=Salinarimonas sp. TaxID=2766526 RepID=UPI0032D8C932
MPDTVHHAMLVAALAAAAAILPIYARGDLGLRAKADDSPVTEADLAAERAIVARLAAAAPDIPIVSEEMAAEGHVPPPSRRFFLVDPLDGTKEFIRRNGEFTVNIALVEDGAPIAGIVLAPAIGRAFMTSADGGALQSRLSDGAPEPWSAIRCREAPAHGLTAVASRSHAGPETDDFLRRYDVARRTSAGSSLKFCLLASGEADLYPRLGRTMEWDTAAGHAILAAAGGRVTTLDGRPLRYGKRGQATDIDFANPDFVAFGPGVDLPLESASPGGPR